MNSPWREYDEIAGTPADPKNNDVLITKLPKDTYDCFSRPIILSADFPRKNIPLFTSNFPARSLPNLPINCNWTYKHIPDRQQCSHFWKSQKVQNHSTLRCRDSDYFWDSVEIQNIFGTLYRNSDRWLLWLAL